VYKQTAGDNYLLIGVYVDDLIITGSSIVDITKFKDEMQRLFCMSDLGLLSYYLGIEVKQGDGEITIGQSSYARKILEVAGISGCNSCHTPMECRLNLGKKNDGTAVDAMLYRSIIGSLRYLVNTRLDISYAVGILSRFMESPVEQHWAAVK
jgi:hypothetical protein